VGVAFSAGTASQSSGTIIFSNSNGVSFGLNNGTLTASVAPGPAAGIAAVQAGTQTQTSGTLAFANSNGVTFGLSGSSQVTASIAAALVFSASNGLAFGTNAGTVTGSYSQSAQAFSASGGSSTFSTLGFANSNGVTFSNSAGSVVASYNSTSAVGQGSTFAGTNVSASMTLNTAGVNLALSAAAGGAGSGVAVSAAGSSQSNGNVVFSNSNGLAFGMNGSTITGSYSQSAQAFSASGGSSTFSTLGFANSNGVTFSNSAGSVVASYNSTSAAGQGTTFAGTNISASMTLNTAGLNLALSGVAGGGGGAALSAAGNSVSNGTVVFSNANGVSFGMAGSTITASASGAGASATVNIQSQSTGQSSSSAYALSNLAFAGYGIISVGNSGGTIQISGPATTNFANLSVSAGTTSGSLGSIVFSNSNGVSFGLNGSTITASAAGGGGGVAIAASNSTFTSGTVVMSAAGGALTISNGAQSALFSVPQTSSLSATGGISISTNGSTISIGYAGTTESGYNPYADLPIVISQLGQGSLLLDPNLVPTFQYDRVLLPIFNTNTNNSSGSHSLTFAVGLYTRNASTLSLLGSTSASTAVTHSGTQGSYSLFSGMRHFSIGSTRTVTAGRYWMAFASSTSSAGADGSYSNALEAVYSANSASNNFNGFFGVAQNNSQQFTLGQGFYSAATSGMPASIAFSQVNGVTALAQNMQMLMFASSTG
jgi:hypothetical protein